MAKVVVRFFDDETLEGVARDLDFDEPGFLVGEVLRGHLDGTLERHRYGVVLHLHAEQSDSPIRKLGIPFSAVKALFFVREFDARGEEAGTASDAYLARRTMAPLLDVLEEMDML